MTSRDDKGPSAVRRYTCSMPGAGAQLSVSALDFDEQVDCGMRLFEENERLRAELADWQRMRNEMRDVAFANKVRAETAEAEVRDHYREQSRILELEVELREATARIAELAAQKPATMRQRVEELERALREATELRESDLDDADEFTHKWRALLGCPVSETQGICNCGAPGGYPHDADCPKANHG